MSVRRTGLTIALTVAVGLGGIVSWQEGSAKRTGVPLGPFAEVVGCSEAACTGGEEHLLMILDGRAVSWCNDSVQQLRRQLARVRITVVMMMEDGDDDEVLGDLRWFLERNRIGARVVAIGEDDGIKRMGDIVGRIWRVADGRMYEWAGR